MEYCAKFNINNRTRFVSSISSGLAIMACQRHLYAPRAERQTRKIEFWFSKYNNSGLKSKILYFWWRDKCILFIPSVWISHKKGFIVLIRVGIICFIIQLVFQLTKAIAFPIKLPYHCIFLEVGGGLEPQYITYLTRS